MPGPAQDAECLVSEGFYEELCQFPLKSPVRDPFTRISILKRRKHHFRAEINKMHPKKKWKRSLPNKTSPYLLRSVIF